LILNFPTSPTTGQLYPSPPVAGVPVYKWDGEKWLLASGGGASVLVSDTPPAGAPDNSLWWESDTGNLYIYYNDGDSTQWVLAVPPSNATINAVRYDSQNLTAAQQAQARQNIYASPFDALAYNGMQINGSMEVSQQFGSAGTTTAGGYIVDGLAWAVTGTMAVTATQGFTLGGPPGLPYQISVTVQTAEASLGATDGVNLYQGIEGRRVARLGWGTANAQLLTIGFWTAHHRTGLYSFAIRNYAQNRSYVSTYTQNVADTFQYNTITVQGDTTGTWAVDNTVGLYLVFSMASGSTGTTSTLNSWQAGTFGAGTGQVNGVAATSDVFRITGVVVLPGIELPSAARAPFIMRPFDQELLLCERYYQKSYSYAQLPGTAIGLTMNAVGFQLAEVGASCVYLGSGYVLPVRMRSTPTVTVYDCAGTSGKIAARISGIWANGQPAFVTPSNETNILVTANNIANCDGINYHYVCDARL
jgi:hypothetical protein